MLVETLVFLATLLTFYSFRVYFEYRRVRESVGCVRIPLYVGIGYGKTKSVSMNDDRDILTFVTLFDNENVLASVLNTSSRLVLGQFNFWLKKHDRECNIAFTTQKGLLTLVL